MKRNSIKKTVAVLLSAVGLSALSLGVAGCVPKSTDLTEPDNVEITKLAPPDDGSLPTAHTCAENLAYISYVFGSQTQYHSYSYGVTAASIATQTTRNFRDYKDGVLITTDLTYSSMVKNGTQTCTVVNEEGESEVYFRVSGAPEANTLPSEASWSEEAPLIFNERSYHYTYGLLPTELFNYIVNEQNIIDSQPVQANPDGTYTQSFTLDPVASTYYYQFGMKTRGGLSGYPEFESIQFSVTFDGDWRILSADMREVAKVNKGVVVTSVSDFSTEYWYGDDHFDDAHYAYYDSYYKQYIGDSTLEPGGSSDEELVVDITNVLSNGFSQIMNGGAQFEITAALGKNTYSGYVFISLDLADPLGTLELKLSLGKELKNQNFFLEYGDGDVKAYYGKDFALGANLAEVKLAVGQFEDIINGIKAVFTKPEQTAPEQTEGLVGEQEGSDPLTALMDSMVLTSGEKQAVLTLDTDDLLGLGIGVNARLVFGINNKAIIFRGATVGGLSMGGEAVDLGLTIRTTTAPEIKMPDGECADLSDYIADVHSLLGSDLIKITAGLHGSDELVGIAALKDIDLDLTAYTDLDGLAVGADVAASYTYKGHRISAAVSVWYDYKAANGGWGEAVLQLTELNGSPRDIRLKCDIKEVYDAISTLLTFGGAEAGSATDGLADIINGALSADLASLISEMYADKAQIKIKVSVDTLLEMFNVNTGVKFGTCALTYKKGDGVYGGELSAELPALGFTLGISGEGGAIQTPDKDSCLDLIYAIDDVKSLMNAELFEAKISLDGGAEGVTLTQLSGIKADLSVQFDPDGLAVAAAVDFSYTYKEQVISAQLTAHYEKGESKYGDLILSLTRINNTPLNANVYCNIDSLAEAVTALLNRAGIQLKPFEIGGGNAGLDDILVKILGADFDKLLPVLETDADGLRLAVNADELLNILGVKTGIAFGNVSLAYSHSGENMLVANAPALGLNVKVNGAEGELHKPSSSDILDLTQLVNTVDAVWKQVDGIIDSQSISFEIAKGKTFLALDGITVDLWGEGEISWKSGREYVALDLCAAITERASDQVAVKLIYDKNATDKPVVRLALNGVGIDIYKDDIDSVTDGFKDIYAKIAPLLGVGDTSEEGGDKAVGDESNALTDGNKLNNDKLMSLIFKALSADNWVEALSRLTLKTDGKSLALEYLSENAAGVEIRADGALELCYDGNYGERFSFGGGIVATAITGELIPAIEAKLESCKMSSSRDEGSAPFIRLAYDYLFEAIDAIGVENILGDSTYTVTFALNGDNCNISGLEGVFIDANIYVTGEKGEQGKLAEADLDINAAGVTVKLNVISERRGNITYFYVDLSQVADIKLPDLKFMATQDTLYATLRVLLNTINNTNVLDLLGKLTASNGGEAHADGEAAPAEPVMTESAIDKICGVLTKLLDFNFSSAVVATETDGVLTAKIDLDNIVKQLGYNTGALGTVEAVINHSSHSMKTSGKTYVTDADGNTQLKEWISLSSELAARRDYSKFDRNEYISIEFLPTLIDDIVKFATDDDGNVHEKFTLSGTVTANIIGRFDLTIDVCTMTVGVNERDGLTFSAIMHVKKVSVIGLVTIPQSTIGITYQNGLLTLARNVDTANPEYKVMTFDYFIDHMLTKNDSVLQWLLNVDGWNILMGVVNLAGSDLNISSGLTTTQDVYLYKATADKEEQEISMGDFVDALKVIINGNTTAVFGDKVANLESALGISDNYYGFSLNAGKVTGGVLTELHAAILRNDRGISGIKAAGAIQSYVTFNADLQYREDWTKEYELGTALGENVTATSFYNAAMAAAEDGKYTVDFDHYEKMPEKGYDEKFGCLSVTNGSNGYEFTTEYSHMLYTHVLTVVGLDGSEEKRNVRHGSTVYFYDNYLPVYTDNGKSMRLLYSLSATEVGEASAVMNGDLTVYAVKRKAVTIYVHNGSEVIELSSFAGDAVPTTVKGLQAITAPTYADGTPVGENDKVGGEQTALHIYGTFVQTVATVNYVNYEFNAKTLTYTAAGKAAGFNDYYSVKGNTLVLENEIGGYPVTAIAANAFANTDGKPIKSVIVPENIVTVGANAFSDNFGMEQAVFLAETVTFEGKDGNSKTMPFYGCSVTDSADKIDGLAGNEITDLHVYYNNIVANGGDWTHFRYVSKVFSFNFYIGKNGGGLHGAGTWQYVDYNVNVDLGGVAGSTLTESAVSDILAPYFPRVTDGEFDGSVEAAEIETALTSALTQFEIMRGGIVYACSFDKSVSQNGNKITVTYNVSYHATAEISVYSACGFTYNGVHKDGGATVPVSAKVVGGKVELSEPKSDNGYAFLGWAVEVNGGMQFAEKIITPAENAVYYAIWGASKVGAEVSAEINYGGNALSAPASGNGKWYDGDWNEVTEISKENTVVYMRSVFTLTYKISGNFTMKVSDTLAGVSGSSKTSYSNSFEILEGQTVYVVKSAGKQADFYVDGVLKTTITLSRWGLYNYNIKDFEAIDTTVSGNISVEMKW